MQSGQNDPSRRRTPHLGTFCSSKGRQIYAVRLCRSTSLLVLSGKGWESAGKSRDAGRDPYSSKL